MSSVGRRGLTADQPAHFVTCRRTDPMTTPTPSTEALDATFTAAIQKDGAFPTYLALAGSDDLLGTRRAVKVAGTLDGHPFEATLMPSGKGPHWLPLRMALCKAIAKSEAGEQVDVRLRERVVR
jgi:Domain of unknown function (DUF1905)